MSDISLSLKGKNKNISQSKGIAGDKTKVLSSKAYSHVCVWGWGVVTYKPDMQKIKEIIPSTDNPMRKVP